MDEPGTMNQPRISVIIPLYNHERYIGEAIESVIAQTVSNFEIIVINDGSTDRSEEAARSIHDDRMAVLSQPNQGAHATINRGFEIARGEFVSVLNSDDRYHPDRFAEFLRVMEADPNVAAVFSHVACMDEEGRTTHVKVGASDNWAGHDPAASFQNQNDSLLDLLAGNFLVTTSNLFCRKSAWRKIGAFRNLKYTHDYDFFLRLAWRFPVQVIPQPLLSYRIHSQNTIRSQNPVVSFEVALVLSDFLIHHDLRNRFPDTDPTTLLPQWYGTLHTYRADRMLQTLTFLGIRYGIRFDEHCWQDSENLFRKICLQDLSSDIEQYRSLQEAWARVSDLETALEMKTREMGEKLIKLDQRLEDAYEETNRIFEESQKAWAAWAKSQEELDVTRQQLAQAREEVTRHVEEGLKKDENLHALEAEHQQTMDSLQEYKKSLDEILASRTFRLATMFRDASHSKKGLLVLPLRLTWSCLPNSVRNILTPTVNGLTRRLFSRHPSVTPIRNVSWPSDRPLVSIVIPCYNYGRFVEEAVDSALAQTFGDLEIIVVDDGSDDPETVSKLNRLNKPRTRVIRQRNLKLPAARNRGIREAGGKYICCLDADDKLAPTYIEKCVYRMETEGLDVCGCMQQNFGNDSTVLHPGEFSLESLWESNHMINAAVFRKSLWKTIGGYDQQMMDGYEDWEFWIRAAARGARWAVIPEPLFFYRKHGRSMIDATLEKHAAVVETIRNKHAGIRKRARHPLPCHVQNRFVNLFRKPGVSERRRHHLLIVMPFLSLGGAERFMSQVGSYLSKNNFDITVVTTVSCPPEMGDTTSWFTNATSGIYHLPGFMDPPGWKDFLFYLIASREIQLVWVVGSTFLYDLLPEIRSYFPGIRVADILFNTVGHVGSNRKYDYCIDLHMTENNEVLEWLIDHGESPSRIVNVPSGVDLHFFQPLEQPDNRVLSVMEPRPSIIVCYCGRFSEEKGPDWFIDIARNFTPEESVGFMMIGGGPLISETLGYIQTTGMEDRIYYMGMVQDVRPYLGSCDILVLPSRLDGRPTAVLQALSMGVPVVASRVGALNEIISDGENGYLCEPGDIKQFVSRIRQIASDPELKQKLKRNARTYAETHLDQTIWLETIASAISRVGSDSRGTRQ